MFASDPGRVGAREVRCFPSLRQAPSLFGSAHPRSGNGSGHGSAFGSGHHLQGFLPEDDEQDWITKFDCSGCERFCYSKNQDLTDKPRDGISEYGDGRRFKPLWADSRIGLIGFGTVWECPISKPWRCWRGAMMMIRLLVA